MYHKSIGIILPIGKSAAYNSYVPKWSGERNIRQYYQTIVVRQDKGMMGSTRDSAVYDSYIRHERMTVNCAI